jgi:hypothetical protein
VSGEQAMKILLYLVVAYLIMLTTITIAGTIDPKIADSEYLSYGSKFKCVVGLCGTEQDDQLYCASGVVIKPRWILTAAHVIKKAKTCHITVDDKKINVSILFPHKKFDSDNFGYYDIGLVYCDEDVLLDFYPELYNQEDELGKTCAISGYGIAGTFNTGAKIGDRKRRAGSNRINNIDRQLLMCDLKDKYTALEFLIASGDSGGGLFIDKKLAGINSCVITSDGRTDSNHNDESGHTRISQHIEWIESTINENEKK